MGSEEEAMQKMMRIQSPGPNKGGNDCDVGHEQFSRNSDTSQEQGVNILGLWLIREGVQRILYPQSLKACPHTWMDTSLYTPWEGRTEVISNKHLEF